MFHGPENKEYKYNQCFIVKVHSPKARQQLLIFDEKFEECAIRKCVCIFDSFVKSSFKVSKI